MDRSGSEVRELAQVQTVLRKAVRRAIEDEDFSSNFESASTVDERWPLPTNWRQTVGL